jgi:hypothetical protein
MSSGETALSTENFGVFQPQLRSILILEKNISELGHNLHKMFASQLSFLVLENDRRNSAGL